MIVEDVVDEVVVVDLVAIENHLMAQIIMEKVVKMVDSEGNHLVVNEVVEVVDVEAAVEVLVIVVAVVDLVVVAVDAVVDVVDLVVIAVDEVVDVVDLVAIKVLTKATQKIKKLHLTINCVYFKLFNLVI